MTVRAGGIWLTVLSHTYVAWIVGAVLQGLGTAIVYPALLASVGDVAHPECGLRLSVSIGSGATWVTLLALCSPAWLRTCWVWRRHAVAVLTLVSGSPGDAADAGDIADQTAESGRDLVCGKRQLERRASTEFAGCVNQDSDRD